MAEFFISGFIIVLFSSIGIKYLYDSCKKESVLVTENIIRPGVNTNLRNENENENEIPPKYEELPPQY